MFKKNKKGKRSSGEKNTFILLSLIVFLGLILRLIGIKHGFPFIFHPDEPTIIRSALGIRFNPNPKHFDWPHLYIYLNYFLYMGFARFRSFIVTLGLRDKSALWMPLIWNEHLIYYYLTRWFSAILGALTAIPVFLAAKQLFGKRAGIFAALAITIMPYHMWHSHYALGDIPTAFLLSWAIFFSTLILKKDEIKNYVLSGLFIGLAASVKYNGGLVALVVPAAHFFKIFWRRHSAGKVKNGDEKIKVLDVKGVLSLILSGFAAFFGFLAGTPYALLDFKTFSRTDGPQGAFWQFKNVGSVSFQEHFVKFFTESFGRLLVDTGYVVIPAFFAGLFYLFFRIVKKKIEEKDVFLIFLYSISLLLIWYLSGFKNSRSHYYFIVYPHLAVIFGYFVFLMTSWFRDALVRLKNEKLIKILSGIFIAILFSPLFIKSVVNSYRYYRGDTRNLLYQWLVDNYDPVEALVYNDKALEDIFGNIGIRSNKGLENVDDFDRALVVIKDLNEEEEGVFLNKNASDLEKVVSFDSNLRLGDDIEIYRYVAPEDTSSDCGCGD